MADDKKSAAKGGPIRVRATRIGFYDLIRRREGDVFTIANEQAFSENWMERVSANTPEKVTSGTDDLRRKHAELQAEKTPQGQKPSDATGDAHVL